jgi:hypothetical protein
MKAEVNQLFSHFKPQKGKAGLLTLFLTAALMVLSMVLSCNNHSQVTEQIPVGPVNLNIDLNLPAYMQLANPGSHAYFEGGVKGVLVIHDYDDTWYAFERGCAFEPLNACAKIWADSVNIQLRCGTPTSTGFQSCCNSKYTYNGFPLEGEARGRLARYQIQRNGNAVMVYN